MLLMMMMLFTMMKSVKSRISTVGIISLISWNLKSLNERISSHFTAVRNRQRCFTYSFWLKLKNEGLLRLPQSVRVSKILQGPFPICGNRLEMSHALFLLKDWGCLSVSSSFYFLESEWGEKEEKQEKVNRGWLLFALKHGRAFDNVARWVGHWSSNVSNLFMPLTITISKAGCDIKE